jgi:hypothetical protein
MARGGSVASSGTPDAGAPNGSRGIMDTSGAASSETDALCPSEPWTGVIPAFSCTSDVEACSSEGGTPGSCNFNPLSVTMAKVAKGCGVYCGSLKVGLHTGCVVDLNPVLLGLLTPQTASGAEDCLELRLLGTRWACATEEGWVTAFLGSCTVAK